MFFILCFVCSYVCVQCVCFVVVVQKRLSDLELELETVISCHVGTRIQNPGLLQEQSVLNH